MKVPRVCITCHAERLGEPVTAKDCLGFAACETCTKPLDEPFWLERLHDVDLPEGSETTKKGI